MPFNRARASGCDLGQGVAHRDELRLGLGQLRLRVGVRDDAAAGEQPDRRAVEVAPSARRWPTRRRRSRPSSPPVRRTGRGPCPRSRRSAARRSRWGSRRPRPRGAAPRRAGARRPCRRRAPRPATSVARCMTLGRCRTNGASGTFIEEQCGSSASATERTAYSCSSRSFEERASVAARAMSRSSSPVRRMVPASTREVTRPRSRRTSISGDRAEQPVDVERPAGRSSPRRAGAAASGRRGGSVGRGDEVPGEHDLLQVPGPDPA